MITRRNILAATLATSCVAASAFAQGQLRENRMLNGKAGPRGPANRSLMAAERTWIEVRFYSEAMMEDGRVPRDLWEKTKLNVIHGNFDIRDPANGDLLQLVEKGVRLKPSP